MPFYSLEFVLALICAAFYFKAGTEELGSGVLWGGISLVLSFVVLFWLRGGIVVVALMQGALLLGIALFRMWRDPE